MTWGRSAAVTIAARHMPLVRHALRAPEGRLLKTDLELSANVAAIAFAYPKGSKDVPKYAVKRNVVEIHKTRAERIASAKGGSATTAASCCLMPKAIVHCPLLRIGKHLIRLIQFLESFGSRGIALIPIGMMNGRKFTKRGFQFFRGCASTYA